MNRRAVLAGIIAAPLAASAAPAIPPKLAAPAEIVPVPAIFETFPPQVAHWRPWQIASFDAWFDGLPESNEVSYRVSNDGVAERFRHKKDEWVAAKRAAEAQV